MKLLYCPSCDHRRMSGPFLRSGQLVWVCRDDGTRKGCGAELMAPATRAG
jgi:hypothetical protein